MSQLQAIACCGEGAIAGAALPLLGWVWAPPADYYCQTLQTDRNGARRVRRFVAMSGSRLGRLETKIESYMADGKYYEAEQLYATVCSRHATAARFADAIQVAADGSRRLLQLNQGQAGVKLAAQVVRLLDQGKLALDDHYKQLIIDTFRAHSDPQAKVSFMKSAIKWSIGHGSKSSLGEPSFHLALAEHYADAGQYGDASKHHVKSGDYDGHCAVLARWAEKVFPSEVDLLVARAVLQYLCLENFEGARHILDKLVNDDRWASRLDTPLIRFCQFLLETLRRDASPLFQMLRSKYAASVDRDASFKNYLDHIGATYFNLQVAGNGPGGMISDLMSSLFEAPSA
ncbi:unnamed protein product (mitochondrion) [Plasmodiophora brassicae]|uniref:Golgi to ER traffic protein 4 homolog n=1 Tax=Plasmodiophora brassicae TaxID=37360 RepID=A0A0G4J0V7_PLABS|nr:hypothetical protein PBRA_008263 [Plasmodiophora brassicae]SPR00952.1 unnamed protein product [Plasmodiophora brassicae]